MSDVNLPPYAQIAAELRDQIDKGTLAEHELTLGPEQPGTRRLKASLVTTQNARHRAT